MSEVKVCMEIWLPCSKAILIKCKTQHQKYNYCFYYCNMCTEFKALLL